MANRGVGGVPLPKQVINGERRLTQGTTRQRDKEADEAGRVDIFQV